MSLGPTKQRMFTKFSQLAFFSPDVQGHSWTELLSTRSISTFLATPKREQRKDDSLQRMVPDMRVYPFSRITKTQIMIDSNHVHATGDGGIREIYYPGSVSEYLLPSEAFDPSVQGTSAASSQKHQG